MFLFLSTNKLSSFNLPLNYSRVYNIFYVLWACFNWFFPISWTISSAVLRIFLISDLLFFKSSFIFWVSFANWENRSKCSFKFLKFWITLSRFLMIFKWFSFWGSNSCVTCWRKMASFSRSIPLRASLGYSINTNK